MLTFILAALAAAGGCAWGAFWALVRDQDGPYWPAKPEGAGSSLWKEVGLLMVGLLPALVWLLTRDVDSLRTVIEAAVIWIGTGAAWSFGHLGGSGLAWSPSRKGLTVRQAYLAMAASGALVTLSTAIVLGLHGAWIWSALVLLAGASKVGWYHLAYVWTELRADGAPADPPHATLLGAIASGATAIAVSAAGIVAGG